MTQKICDNIGANNLTTDKTPDEIFSEILPLIKDLKTDKNNTVVSTIVPRSDAYNTKSKKVNTLLKEFLRINSKQDNNFLTIKQQRTEHAKSTRIHHLNINSIKQQIKHQIKSSQKYCLWSRSLKRIRIIQLSQLLFRGATLIIQKLKK